MNEKIKSKIDEIVKGNQEYLNAYTSYLNEVKRQYNNYKYIHHTFTYSNELILNKNHSKTIRIWEVQRP